MSPVPRTPRLGAIVGWERPTSPPLRFSPGASSGVRSATSTTTPATADGHHIKGDYVFVLLQDGGDYFIHVNDIISVQP
jgi:hypothetical protein